ncbi:MAG: hypothetical protein NC229_08540 [Bacteroides sp.]|nr:hypothetical protein [Bacteroidales bacterium]MCM1068708.1 hypothetical protein [Prevotella sp.]MCM1354692.1 hypothetical protein [Bacteroides sp.]MCM1403760.1 hypothetical protein [Bacteroides sp.]MCM1443522.1 hypothetical protein [Muribaculum sp.]
MAVSLTITAANLLARVEGIAKDAREAKMRATALGVGVTGTEDVKMAADTIITAAEKATRLLKKVRR